MQKTPFAGLTRLNPNESLSTDGFSFQDKNVGLIDYFIELALTHRHDGHAALADPIPAPSAAIDPTGGSIPADITLHIGYTLIDSFGGETLLSDTDLVTTEPPFDAPASAPVAEVEYGIGSILIGTYYYGVTLLDGGGGESSMSPWVQVERLPGDANARVNLSGLTEDFLATGAVAWRLYRSKVGSHFDLLAEGTLDTYTDDGTVPVDCDVHPPSDFANTTNSANKAVVQVPSGAMGAASSFNLYASLDGSFTGACLVGNFDTSLAGTDIEILTLGFLRGSPPDVSTSKAGLSKIDADTELLNFHWLQPVDAVADLPAGVEGDVRLVLQASAVYGVLAGSAVVPADWTQLNFEEPGGGGGGGSLGIYGSAAYEGGPEAIPGIEWLSIINFDYPGQPAAMVVDAGGGSGQIYVRGTPVGANTYTNPDPIDVFEAGSAAVGSGAAVIVNGFGITVDPDNVGFPPYLYDIRWRGDCWHEDGLGGTGRIGIFIDGVMLKEWTHGTELSEEISLADHLMFTLEGSRIGISDFAVGVVSPGIGEGVYVVLEPGYHDVDVRLWSEDGSSVFCGNQWFGVTPRPPG